MDNIDEYYKEYDITIIKLGLLEQYKDQIISYVEENKDIIIDEFFKDDRSNVMNYDNKDICYFICEVNDDEKMVYIKAIPLSARENELDAEYANEIAE